MSNLYWLSEDQMARLRPYFPKSHGVPRVDDRRVLGGIMDLHRFRSGLLRAILAIKETGYGSDTQQRVQA
jgi:transposase